MSALLVPWPVALGLCQVIDENDRLTATDEAVGSRLYIAPENESGINESLDQRPADFYAFAKIGWAVLAGRNPPAREGQLKPGLRLSAILDDRFAATDRLFERLLDTDPRSRLADWDVVVAELGYVRQVLAGVTRGRAEPGNERLRTAAMRFVSSPAASATRQQHEHRSQQEAWQREVDGALARGGRTISQVVDSLSAELAPVISMSVSTGGPRIEELAVSLPELAAIVSGTTASNSGSPSLLTVSGSDPEQFPSFYYGTYAVLTADETWLQSIPMIYTWPGAVLHVPQPLYERIGRRLGPLPAQLESSLTEAEILSAASAQVFLDAASEFLTLVQDQLDPLDVSNWKQHRRHGPP